MCVEGGTIYPVEAFVVLGGCWGKGVKRASTQPAVDPVRNVFSAESAFSSCVILQHPCEGKAGSDLRALQPSFPGLARENSLLPPPFAPLRTEESACVYSGGFIFIDQLFGVFVEDKAYKPNQCS